ncbi:hypothetical protein EBZ80_15900 [bacterium]|nr:hypothetical protein [bacterium]
MASSITLEAAAFKVTALKEGRIRIELEDADLSCLESAAPVAVYDKRKLAQRLGVTKRSIDNYIRQSRNPLPYTLAMGRARFLETDVEEWLRAGASPAARRVRARLSNL